MRTPGDGAPSPCCLRHHNPNQRITAGSHRLNHRAHTPNHHDVVAEGHHIGQISLPRSVDEILERRLLGVKLRVAVHPLSDVGILEQRWFAHSILLIDFIPLMGPLVMTR